jgi:hypothetical protein
MPEAANSTPTNPPKRKLLRRLLIAGGVVVALFIIALVSVLLYFNDNYFKAQIKSAIKENLGRESEISSLQVSIFGGSVSIDGLRILGAQSNEKDMLRCEQISAKIDVWPLITSGGTRIQSLNADLRKPEFSVERNGQVSSIDDILERLSKGPKGTWPKATGLKALSFDVKIHDGTASFKDAGPLGESRAEKIELTASMESIAAPLASTLKFALVTPDVKTGGNAELSAALRWIDSNGTIDPAAFSDLKLSAKLTNCDIPHLTRYAGVDMIVDEDDEPPAGEELHCTLGKPIDGELNIEAASLAAIKTKLDTHTAGVIALWRKGQLVAGNLPSHMNLNAEFGIANGSFKAKSILAQFEFPGNEAGADAKTKMLNLTLNVTTDGPAQTDSAKLNGNLDKLFATDVGKALQLNDSIGGEVEGSVDAHFDPKGNLKLTATFKTDKGFAIVQGTRQPLAVAVDANADVQAKDGKLDNGELTFNAHSASAEIRSVQPIKIGSLSDLTNLSADGVLRVHAGGREFWKEFGPLLKVLNLRTPLEEALDGEVRITGTTGKIKLEMDQTLQRQVQPASPIVLNIRANYDGSKLNTLTTDKPFLTFDVKLKTEQPSPMAVGLSGSWVSGRSQRTIDVQATIEGELATLTLLNQRFGAYIDVLLPPPYSLKGVIAQKWTSHQVDQINAAGDVTSSEFKLNTDLKISNLSLSGPVLLPGRGAVEWAEPEGLSLQLALEKNSKSGATQLKLPVLKFTSKTATFDGSLGESDLNTLKAAAAQKPQTFSRWLAAMPKTTVNAKVTGEAIRRLNAMGVIDPELVEPGDLTISADYDPTAHRGEIRNLAFKTPQIDIAATVTTVDALALAQLSDNPKATLSQWAAALPSLTFTGHFGPRPLAYLFDRGGMPALFNDATLTAAYDSVSHKATGFSMTLGGGSDTKLTSPSMDIAELAAALESVTQKRDAAVLLAALPDFEVQGKCKTALFDFLRTYRVMPDLPVVQGDLSLSAKYDRFADRLTVQSLRFARAADGKLPLSKAELSFEVANVKQLLPVGPDWIATFSKHLDKGFHATDVTVVPGELCAWLKQSGSKDAWIEDFNSGVYRTAPFVIHKLDLTATQPGTFNVAVSAETPLEWHPRPAPDKPASPAALAALAGSWSSDPAEPISITLAQDQRSIKASLILDASSVSATTSGFNYVKPAGTACKLQLAATLDGAGNLRIPSVQLTGGPFPLAASGIAYAPPVLSLEKATLSLGPQPATISAVVYDPTKDHLQATVSANSVEMAQLNSFLKLLPPAVSTGGSIVNVTASYDGRISAFEKGFKPDDKLALSATAKDLQLNARAGAESAALTMNGRLDGDTTHVASPGMDIRIQDQPAGHAPIPQHLTFTLSIAPKDKGAMLLDALKQPGLPLLLNIPLTSDANISVDALVHALDTFSAASSTGPSSGAGDLSAIKALHVDASITAPSALVGTLTIREPKIPLTVDGPAIALANARMKMFGGEIIIHKGTYNIAANPLAHSTEFELSGVDLHELTGNGVPPKQDEYEILGSLTGSGTLTGAGFDQAQRASWSGKVDGKVNGFTAQKNGGKQDDLDLKKSGAAILGMLGSGIDNPLVGMAGRATALWGANGGLFLNKLEFEPVNLNLTLTKGRLDIARSNLIGKGHSAGLQLDFAGAIDVAKETFAPRMTLWLIKLPPTTESLLRIDHLSDADRNTIRKEFSDSRFAPIQLTGSLYDPAINKGEVGNAFMSLDGRIDQMLRSKSPSQTQTPQPAQSQQPATNPPKSKKPGALDRLQDLFGN